jgi:predicted TIM-barrel fold metal-dependent hydrolase
MSCVDASLVIGHRADLVGAHIPNELIADFVSRDPQHRLGIAGIDPLADSVDQDLTIAMELGLVGIALTPPLAGFNPTHSSAMRIYERCCDNNLPVIITMPQPLPASAVLDFARPIHWDEVARTYPELRILFTQMGFPWIDELLVLAGKHKHVFAEVSGVATRPWQVYNALSTAWSLDVMDRLLFGSGFPMSTPQQAIESLYSVNVSIKGTLLPPIPRARVKEIVERDALACLGIEHSTVSSTPSTASVVTKTETISSNDS